MMESENNHGKPVEPVTRWVNEETQVRVLVELPGVDETKIRIELENHTLVIIASDRKKIYKKEIPLSQRPRISSKKFRNGVLEITLEKIDS
jgi:HSP20 family molecular chaperone IbpA